jgi:alanyl-tRNA synthetase
LAKLHKETESRTAARLAATESRAREARLLTAGLAAAGAEAIRLREERERSRKARGDALATGVEGLDALEDEATAKLQRRIRELEGENFELRRGAWREKRRDLQPSVTDVDSDGREVVPSAVEEFDEVDLSGSGKPRTQQHNQRQKHSSFSTVINSGLAAFRAAASVSPVQRQGRPRQDSLLEEFDDDGEEGGFDEAAFAAAQREEEARKMVEHVREVKRGLSKWKGWRLDLVDSRRALGGGGGGWGDVFEV